MTIRNIYVESGADASQRTRANSEHVATVYLMRTGGTEATAWCRVCSERGVSDTELADLLETLSETLMWKGEFEQREAREAQKGEDGDAV